MRTKEQELVTGNRPSDFSVRSEYERRLKEVQ